MSWNGYPVKPASGSARWILSNLDGRHIYDSPQTIEEPNAVQFIELEAVEGMPDARPVVPLGSGFIPSICNFRIDEAKAMEAVDALLRERIPVTT